jgi:hypothetical protein
MWLRIKVSGSTAIHANVEKCIQDRLCWIETRCNEHDQHLHSYELDKSAVAEHGIESGHWIKFQETEVLAKTIQFNSIQFNSGYMDQPVKDTTELRLHPDSYQKRGRIQT